MNITYSRKVACIETREIAHVYDCDIKCDCVCDYDMIIGEVPKMPKRMDKGRTSAEAKCKFEVKGHGKKVC